MPHPPARLARWFPLAVCLLHPSTLGQPGLTARAQATDLAALTPAAADPRSPRAAPDAAGAVPAPGASPQAAPPAERLRIMTVRRGDTLARLLAAAGLEEEDAAQAIGALTGPFPARRLQPGQELTLHLDPQDPTRLLALELAPEPGRLLRAHRDATSPQASWSVTEERTPEARHLVLARGEIRGSLLASVQSAGVPPPLALSLVRLLGHEVDFERDLHPGDRFTVLFDRFRDPDGDLLRDGALVHVELRLADRRLAYWRHPAVEEGEEDAWYDEAGRSLRRGLLRTPLDGARMSSGFGMRSHPVLGFTRMHRGVDFAAPSGTPVYAASDGVVLSARFERGYGRTIRLRHAGGMETLYAHLSGFARGLKAGETVRQGEVIGRVGSTGLSTGPHLHYEVQVAGRAVDPSNGPHTAARTRLEGRALAAFQRARGEMQTQLARLAPFEEVAWAE
jgi:murein DD-endopeptidase MepM/ murein hydrolase activator NlpD